MLQHVLWFTSNVSSYRMVALSTEQALDLLMEENMEDLDSGEETEIEEYPAFSLTQPDHSG